jgi:N-methylhydantoinase A
VKAVSTYRGRDPRDFALFAFGGNGGIHAAALAGELGMAKVIVPPGAGVFSAVGLLFTDHEVSRSVAFGRPLLGTPDERTMMREVFERLERSVRAELSEPAAQIRWRADLRYHGQGFELGIDVPPGALDDTLAARLRAAFEAEHRRSYGHGLGEHRIDVVTLRVLGSVPPQGPTAIHGTGHAPRMPGLAMTRPAYFGPEHGLLDTPVIDRADLDASARRGPLIIEEYEGTTIVPPEATALRDGGGNIIITLGLEAAL